MAREPNLRTVSIVVLLFVATTAVTEARIAEFHAAGRCRDGCCGGCWGSTTRRAARGVVLVRQECKTKLPILVLGNGRDGRSDPLPHLLPSNKFHGERGGTKVVVIAILLNGRGAGGGNPLPDMEVVVIVVLLFGGCPDGRSNTLPDLLPRKRVDLKCKDLPSLVFLIVLES